MGTRGAYGFRLDRRDLVTYNHYDSYPEELGAQFVAWRRRHSLAELWALARRSQAERRPSAVRPPRLGRFPRPSDPLGAFVILNRPGVCRGRFSR